MTYVSSPPPPDLSSMANAPTSPTPRTSAEPPDSIVDTVHVRSIWDTADGKVSLYLGQANSLLAEARKLTDSTRHYHAIHLALKMLTLALRHCTSTPQKFDIIISIFAIYIDDLGDNIMAEEYANKAIELVNDSDRPVVDFNLARVISLVSSNTFAINHISKHTSGSLTELLRIRLLLASPASTETAKIRLDKLIASNHSMSSEFLAYLYAIKSVILLKTATPTQVLDLEYPPVEAPQLIAIKYLMKLLAAVRVPSIDKIRHYIKKLNHFIGFHQSGGWNRWDMTGVFDLELLHGAALKVEWLTPSELIIVFYIISGIGYITMNETGKSMKSFEKARTVVEKSLVRLTEGDEQAHGCQSDSLRRKMTHYKISIIFYQAWYNFNRNNYELGELSDLLDHYNQRKCSSFETEAVEHLRPQILYLFGIYHMAKRQYSKAESFFELITDMDDVLAFASLQLLILAKQSQDEGQKKLEFIKIQEYLSNIHTSRYNGTTMFGFSYEVVKTIFADSFNTECLEVAMMNDAVKAFPILHKIIALLVSEQSMNPQLKQQALIYLQDSTISKASGDETETRINALILEVLLNHFKETGDQDKFNLAELQLKYYKRVLNE
ncbi:hypothetical protein DIURU_000663 [Diutina rugosa]|uniref:Cohesin loading factor n=1 Tax=Diutina rugosa TaxID=5481 RepID=A0A642UWT7_DIURU|nr:uncharacterized protein DIURU_000663 [Diutina rugosa]KAA8906979.1 hypothetical protein DIURU_000663 [Diutina rugosa]